MNRKRIFVAGHRGTAGSAIYRALQNQNTDQITVKNLRDLDLTDQAQTLNFFTEGKFDQVYLAAAKVGGILANDTYPAEFIYQNLLIESNVIHCAYRTGVKKLLFLGSACIYPKITTQPIAESALLRGMLEPTNEPYAIAKIAGIKLCESYNRQYGCDYRSVMPTNLYGPNDNFHPQNAHVLPALLYRFHQAKINKDAQITVWGSGEPRREFLYIDDLASACIHIMNLEHAEYQKYVQSRLSHINIGTGKDCTIRELAQSIGEVVGYQGEIVFDRSKPDGTPRRLLDVAKLTSLGWKYSIGLEEGLQMTYRWLQENIDNMRK